MLNMHMGLNVDRKCSSHASGRHGHTGLGSRGGSFFVCECCLCTPLVVVLPFFVMRWDQVS